MSEVVVLHTKAEWVTEDLPLQTSAFVYLPGYCNSLTRYFAKETGVRALCGQSSVMEVQPSHEIIFSPSPTGIYLLKILTFPSLRLNHDQIVSLLHLRILLEIRDCLV